MRILHIITSLRIGGAEQMVAELLPRLRDRGHHVELLLFDGTRTPIYERVEQAGIAIHVLGRGALNMWNPLHAFRLRIFLRSGRFDIVHTHNTPAQLLTALAAPAADAPILVTTEHNTFNRRSGWRWYAAADRRMYRSYGHIICVSEATRRNLARRLDGGGTIPPMSVVPNGIDIKPYLDIVPDNSMREAEDEGRRIIIMVSAFRMQKDHPTLLRAMLHLPDDYRLWLVGDWIMRSSRERLAEELGIRSRVRFWGFRSDVPALMAAADAVVLSSHYEGMSLSSIEALASGKPFIASDVEGLHDVVEGAGLLFPEGDHERLAELVRKVCEDAEYGAQVAARCRERARRYDIVRAVADYERIYYSLLNNEKKVIL